MSVISIILMMVLVLLTLWDIKTTQEGIEMGMVEINPVVKFFMKRFGEHGWIYIKFTVILIILITTLFLPVSAMLIILILLDLFYAFVVYRNYIKVEGHK